MSRLSQVKKDLISQAYSNFKDTQILIFNSISGQSFDTFRNILVGRNAPIENEEFVFFRDLTMLRGGQEGVLITNKHLYYYQWGFQQIVVADIVEIKMSGLFNENLVFNLKDHQTISIAIWASNLFNEIKAVITILQVEDEVKTEEKATSHQVRCLGCKAIIRSDQNFCEYCRSPLS